jgi:hypothetical protein
MASRASVRQGHRCSDRTLKTVLLQTKTINGLPFRQDIDVNVKDEALSGCRKGLRHTHRIGINFGLPR